MENELTILERFNHWLKESIMIKLLSIGFLVLILLIPTAWIINLMEERQSRAESVISEIASKWSGSQTLSGPILVIPFKDEEKIYHSKENIETREYTRKAFFLPDNLSTTGDVKPEILHRGIFDAAVYESSLNMNATFGEPDFEALNINRDKVLWKDAYLAFAITDLRGISDMPVINLAGKQLTAEQSNKVGITIRDFGSSSAEYGYVASRRENNSSNGIISKVGWKSAEDFTGNVQIKLSLKGSNRMSFVPIGKTTSVELAGPWPDPSFEGEFLPVTRQITDKDFKASWKVLHFNRAFAQQWVDTAEDLTGAEFGVRVLVPVDQYQKSIRTAKYGILIVLLTFIALFLVEITKKVRIHPFQYILIGVALIIYYTLLLSLSELPGVGYNMAYWISTVATTALIGSYSSSFLKGKMMVTLFSGVLMIFYSFIFIIILQQDFSLLIGSVGLFVIVALLMYFSRNVNWYKESVPNKV